MAVDRKFLRTQASEIDSMRSQFWKPKAPGKYRFRLLDGWENSKTYFVDVATHYQVGPTKARVVCPRLTSMLAKKNQECPVCDRVLELLGGNENQKALASDMRANVQYLMNIYLRPSTTELGGLKIARFGKSIHDSVFELVMDQENFGDITDVNTGRDLILTRKGTGLDTEYLVMPADPTPFLQKSEAVAGVLKKRANLTQFVVAETTKDIINKLQGATEEAEAAEAGVDDGSEGETATGEMSTEGVEGEVIEEPPTEEEELPVEEEAAPPVVTKPRFVPPPAARPAPAQAAKTFAAIRARIAGKQA